MKRTFYVDYIDWANMLLDNPTRAVVVEIEEKILDDYLGDCRTAIRDELFRVYGDVAVSFLYEEC